MNFLFHFLGRCPVFIVVDVQRDYFDGFGKPVLQLQKLRKVLDAVASPQGPQVDDDDLPFVAGDQLVCLARRQHLKRHRVRSC